MKCWYAIQSKPQKEDLLCEQLSIRGIEVYYPRLRAQVINPRARKFRPYFPGYMFINVDIEKTGTSALQWMPGAISMVSFGNEVISVPENLIEAIRLRVKTANNENTGLLSHLKPGDVVVLHSGSFSGYEAIFDSHLLGQERVRVLLKLLENQHVRVVVPAGQISLSNRP